jgi:hypothetical protein
VCSRSDSGTATPADGQIMDEKHAQDLAERFRLAGSQTAEVSELQGDEARDFVFVADRPVLLESFKVNGDSARLAES